MGTNIFIVVVNKKLEAIPGLASIGLRGNAAVGQATSLKNSPPQLGIPTRIAYQDALRMSCVAFIPVAAARFLVSFLIRDLPLPDNKSSDQSEDIAIEQTASIEVQEYRIDSPTWDATYDTFTIDSDEKHSS